MKNGKVLDVEPISRACKACLLKETLKTNDHVANFNVGRKACILIYEKLKMIPGKYTLKGRRSVNVKRLFASKYKNCDTTKNAEK